MPMITKRSATNQTELPTSHCDRGDRLVFVSDMHQVSSFVNYKAPNGTMQCRDIEVSFSGHSDFCMSGHHREECRDMTQAQNRVIEWLETGVQIKPGSGVVFRDTTLDGRAITVAILGKKELAGG